MLKISPFLFATAVSLAASTGAVGMPVRPSTPDDISFVIFFDPGAASLTREGREIISVAAKRFVIRHGHHSAARMFVTGETDAQDVASLSNERIKAVSSQLVRDGVQRRFVSADQRPSVHAEAVRLEEALDRRVSISIQDEPVVGGL